MRCESELARVRGHSDSDTKLLTGAVFLAAFEASCLRGAFPPVDLRAVCLVRAIARKVFVDAAVEAVDDGGWDERGGPALQRVLYSPTRGATARDPINKTAVRR